MITMMALPFNILKLHAACLASALGLALGKTASSTEDLLATVLLLGTLLLGDLVDLLGKTVANETVTGLELLEGVDGVVDQTEASGATTTVVVLEVEDADLVLLNFVALGQALADLVLGDVALGGVDNVNDELGAVKQRVTQELAGTNGDRVRHDGLRCGCEWNFISESVGDEVEP